LDWFFWGFDGVLGDFFRMRFEWEVVLEVGLVIEGCWWIVRSWGFDDGELMNIPASRKEFS
jgi:hypothetical protein